MDRHLRILVVIITHDHLSHTDTLKYFTVSRDLSLKQFIDYKSIYDYKTSALYETRKFNRPDSVTGIIVAKIN